MFNSYASGGNASASIIGEDSFLCEIVTLDDFYGGVDNGNTD